MLSLLALSTCSLYLLSLLALYSSPLLSSPEAAWRRRASAVSPPLLLTTLYFLSTCSLPALYLLSTCTLLALLCSTASFRQFSHMCVLILISLSLYDSGGKSGRGHLSFPASFRTTSAHRWCMQHTYIHGIYIHMYRMYLLNIYTVYMNTEHIY